MLTRFALLAAAASLASCGAGADSTLLDSPEQVSASSVEPGAVHTPMNDDSDDVASLRARGAEGLAEALARYDAATGDDKAALADFVDRVAGQRYATYSRLFWYTDRRRALEAARDTGKPVLSLRLLGRLDEDYSCANSRFFRVVLYANAKVSDYLRESFVLHWSSERDAPKITVDYGDGRVMHRTIAGNSAHYVLDSRGRPIDVLAGLYGPQQFLEALEQSRALAIEAGAMDDDALGERLVELHQGQMNQLQLRWNELGEVIRVPSQFTADTSLQTAEMLTMSKMMIEVPMASRVKLGTQMNSVQWDELLRQRLVVAAKLPVTLDERSRALIAALRPSDWQADPGRLDPAGLDALITAFETNIAADTLINELTLRWQIHNRILNPEGPRTFDALNEWMYTSLFKTPASDPWLGMSAAGAFVGLPGDGIATAHH